ncbi:LysR family transcriptional regulator [Tropicimonas sp. IMCC6043]|uniref:LysR family transcriptional regulator n=1 Tax=Tropicimonas sp. IMCC6043 TaxID=2510645 RepID=UPI0013EA4BCC|nr:LysR family transcriptional regulator [Tropicimonas sp. IMCC6043]
MSLSLVPRVLRYVEAVAEHGSIQATSRAIGISASAIDRQIKLLEDHLDVQLFDRQSTGMETTVAGEMFIVLARRWRAEENTILSDVKRMQGIDLGLVRLATMDSLANGPLPRALSVIARDFPRVQIEVEIMTPDQAVAALNDGTADLALGFNIKAARDLHLMWTVDLPLVCVCAPDHPVADLASISVKEVRGFPLVVQSRALAIRRMLEARHSWLFTNAQPPVVTNSLQLLKQLVAAGTHLALTSQLDAASELANGRMVAIPISDTEIRSQSISLAVSVKRTLPRICSTVAEVLIREMSTCVNEITGASR